MTGALLLTRGCFYQILEGHVDAVETIFEAVQRDYQHRNIKVLYSKPLESRNFAQWSMAFSSVDSQELAIDGMSDPDQLGQYLVKILINLINGKQDIASIV